MTANGRCPISWRSIVARLPIVLLLAVPAMAEQSSAMAIAFEERQLTVTGVTPGHRIVALGLGIGSHGRASLLTRHAEALPDDDQDGNVTFRPFTLPLRSLWV